MRELWGDGVRKICTMRWVVSRVCFCLAARAQAKMC